MDLDNAAMHARNTMELYQLDGWSFAFDNAKRRCGQCTFNKKRITLSRYYVELNTPAEVHETILHEIAHALVGPGHGHGPKWCAMARKVGAKPQRCADASVKMPEAKYQLMCTSGHDFGPRHRKNRNMDMHVCGRCHSPLRYVLTSTDKWYA
jgi:predicted SprT family Zn-dependent metalloprotease